MIGPNGDTQTVIVTNAPKGGLIVEKYDKITKQPLAGAQFKIVYSNGELLPDNEGLTSSNGLYTTDQNGQIVLSKVQPGTLIVTEDKAPDFYQKDPTPQTVVVNAGDTQVMPGQAIRYDFSGIANNSTTALSSFYWRDTLPAALRLDKIVTGTYNVQGNYKIVYKTNLSGETYRVMM